MLHLTLRVYLRLANRPSACPVSRASKLKSQVVLSTNKADTLLCHKRYMPIMNLLHEMREQDFRVSCTKP
jgi:hypothetical protein